MKQIIFIAFVLVVLQSQAQNFQKIYLFEDTFAFVNDIYITDSCYYFQGSTGSGTQRCDVVFGKMNLNGEIIFKTIDVVPNEFNISYASKTQLDTNFRGNFTVGYTNRLGPSFGNPPNYTEVDPLGAFIQSINLDFLSNDSLVFFDNGQFKANNFDSTLIGFFTYANATENPSNPKFGEVGVLLFKMSVLGDTLWTRKFHNLGVGQYKPRIGVNDIVIGENGNILLMMVEFHSPTNVFNQWSKLHFFELNQNGNTLSQQTFQDSYYTFSSNTFLPLQDGSKIVVYHDSRIGSNSSGSPVREYRAVMSKLNASHQMVWKDTVDRRFVGGLDVYSNPMRMALMNDSVFAGAHMRSFATMYDSAVWNSLRVFQFVRIFNKTIHGETLWNRDYVYWQPEDSLNDPYYKIKDFELTPDGGFIACGSVFHTDSIMAGNIGQFGYVLKTNCLGFLGEPQAAFSYETEDSLQLSLQNTSIQSGSYLWDFGDGTQLATNEFTTNVSHQYATAGEYVVTLIGYGCNGSNDTLTALVTIPEIPTDTTVIVGDGTLLTVFPNPVQQGASLSMYVGNISEGTTTFEMLDYAGKLIFSGNIPKGNSTYIFPINLASGMYVASLREGKKVLEVERVVVQ